MKMFRYSHIIILGVFSLMIFNSVVCAEEFVTVSFEFSNGITHQTTVSDDEVRNLLNRNFGYMVEWWVHGALAKLNLQYKEKAVNAEGAVAIVSIDGIANNGNGVWVYYVNGNRSKYHINTQSREGVRNIRFVYEKGKHS